MRNLLKIIFIWLVFYCDLAGQKNINGTSITIDTLKIVEESDNTNPLRLNRPNEEIVVHINEEYIVVPIWVEETNETKTYIIDVKNRKMNLLRIQNLPAELNENFYFSAHCMKDSGNSIIIKSYLGLIITDSSFNYLRHYPPVFQKFKIDEENYLFVDPDEGTYTGDFIFNNHCYYSITPSSEYLTDSRFNKFRTKFPPDAILMGLPLEYLANGAGWDSISPDFIISESDSALKQISTVHSRSTEIDTELSEVIYINPDLSRLIILNYKDNKKHHYSLPNQLIRNFPQLEYNPENYKFNKLGELYSFQDNGDTFNIGVMEQQTLKKVPGTNTIYRVFTVYINDPEVFKSFVEKSFPNGLSQTDNNRIFYIYQRIELTENYESEITWEHIRPARDAFQLISAESNRLLGFQFLTANGSSTPALISLEIKP